MLKDKQLTCCFFEIFAWGIVTCNQEYDTFLFLRKNFWVCILETQRYRWKTVCCKNSFNLSEKPKKVNISQKTRRSLQVSDFQIFKRGSQQHGFELGSFACIDSSNISSFWIQVHFNPNKVEPCTFFCGGAQSVVLCGLSIIIMGIRGGFVEPSVAMMGFYTTS